MSHLKRKRVKIRAKDLPAIVGSNKDAGKHEETYQTSNDMNDEADTSSDELDIEANDPSKDVTRHTNQTPNEYYEESETNSEELEIEANISS